MCRMSPLTTDRMPESTGAISDALWCVETMQLTECSSFSHPSRITCHVLECTVGTHAAVTTTVVVIIIIIIFKLS